jgi:hypothetical protein
MFYLIYVIFLFAGHGGLLAATGAAPWGVAWPGVVVGWRDRGGSYWLDVEETQLQTPEEDETHKQQEMAKEREGSSSEEGDEEGAQQGETTSSRSTTS